MRYRHRYGFGVIRSLLPYPSPEPQLSFRASAGVRNETQTLTPAGQSCHSLWQNKQSKTNYTLYRVGDASGPASDTATGKGDPLFNSQSQHNFAVPIKDEIKRIDCATGDLTGR
ncbi:hypothetical protein LSAT2_018942 [Lamellibrachia satsuma]|nr:hypothetical protein LSAT2_018942 [Lamellibrachia satsuma]